jgi:hypothetical protein
MQPKQITELKEAIRAQHGCEALYIRTIHVNETLEGVTPWHALMMVFELIGHPEAECCYAWISRNGAHVETFAVLQLPPVTTPGSALQFAFAAKAEPKQSSSQAGSPERESAAVILD